MLFNSVPFLFFFPIAVCLFYLVPKKWRYLWLLVISYFFYMCWNPQYIILLAVSTFVTWLSGNLISVWKNRSQKNGKWVVAGSFLINLSILAFFKYTPFILENVTQLCNMLGIGVAQPRFDIILPVGISFYTFQALSYTVDVYRGTISPERNLLKYALFVSFFPQLVAGPIERSDNLLRQIRALPTRPNPSYRMVVNGLVVMLWGFFMKMVIADRIAVLVNTVYDSYYIYGSFELIAASVGFAIQIYCDFASYSLIAAGSAQVMGFSLMENFNTPYFSRSIQEFWRRWHISLSGWFRDYLYIPLGGSRCTKKRHYFNIMLTFLASGLWHGANWTFVIWGGLHGLYQIIGAELRPLKDKVNRKCGSRTDTFSYRLGQAAITFVLTDVAWIFFRSDSVQQAFMVIERIFFKIDPWVLFDGTMLTLGLDAKEMIVLFIALAILLIADVLRYKKQERFDEALEKECVWFRIGVVLFLIAFIFVYGSYGVAFNAQQFIYFQF